MTDTFIVVDTETTGLDAKLDKVIEIGAVKVERGRVADTFDTFVNPGRRISEFITGLTGITGEMLEGAPGEEEAFQSFLKFAGDEILLGHHLIFDYSFLKRMAVNQRTAFERKGIDTLKIARVCLPQLEKRSLEYLCTYYGIVNAHAHRACDDAMATLELYRRMTEQFYDGTPEKEKLFSPEPLVYQAKKESPITAAQVRYLKALAEYHHLTLDEEIEQMTKNAASRKIDQILSAYGRIL